MNPERTHGPETRSQVGALAGLLALGAAAIGARAWWDAAPSTPELVVEVAGEVPRPGTYALPSPATVSDALRAAGAEIPSTDAERPLETGTRVALARGRVAVGPMRDPLVLGLPVDLNNADAEGLGAVPGIGPSRAQAIVADREANGVFETVDALDRVRGFGPATVDAVAPYLSATPRRLPR